jgi:hypothetical protein
VLSTKSCGKATDTSSMSLTNGVITAIPAPEGYVVNFDNPARQGNIAGYGVSAVGMVLAFLFMVQRLYVKVFIGRSFGLDDGTLRHLPHDKFIVFTQLTYISSLSHLGVGKCS